MRARSVAAVVGLALALLAAGTASAQEPPADEEFSPFVVEVETGPAWQTRNDVQIPNDPSGTRFSLRDVTGSGPWPAGRLYLTWRLGESHALRALVAPLQFTESGRLPESVDFAGSSYAPDVPTDATYRFNSYRLSYLYRFHHGRSWTWNVGFTAKMRDAVVRLEQGGTTSEKTDLGFVPLFHVSGEWRFAPRWHAELDADALAGGPGRAEDVTLQAGYDLSDRWTLSAGYRTVEGGADVDSVYAFAWLHYGVVSLEYRF
ncbi:MAG: hypothetical protein Q8W44_03295 [Candidatus Palauibacterales bacterium]|nr:hypothetical protein [Candidatus Palauibacterales bacterium]